MAASNTDDRDDDVPGNTPGELGDDDVAARWADIVATLGDMDGSRVDDEADDRREPAESSQTSGPDDDGDAADETDESDPDPAQEAETGTRQPSGPRDWPLSPEAAALEEGEAHFTPPVPPPVLSRDPLLTMAWSFVAGVPVLAIVGMVVVAAVPALAVPPLVGQIGVGLFVAGLGVLIWRMPHQRDPDDDGPGAVV